MRPFVREAAGYDQSGAIGKLMEIQTRNELGPDAGPKICLMLCRCRTGSTSITNAVRDLPYAYSFAEILNPKNSYSYQYFLARVISRAEKDAARFATEGPLFAISEYMSWLVEQAREAHPKLEVLIIETKIENLYVFGEIWTHPTFRFNFPSIIDRLSQHVTSHFVLQRRNVVERFLSNTSATVTGVYHSRIGSPHKMPDSIAKFKVQDVAGLVNALVKEIGFDKYLLDMIKYKYKNTFNVFYEDAFSDGAFTEQFRELFVKKLNIEITTPNYVKARVMSGAELIENFSELEAAILAREELRALIR